LIGKADFIGTCSVDLRTLAAGPTSHDIQLRDGTKTTGRIQFTCLMEHITELKISLKNVYLKGLPSAGDYSLSVYYSGRKDKPFKSSVQPGTDSPKWDDLYFLSLETTLRSVFLEGIGMDVFRGSEKIGTAELRMTKYLVTSEDARVSFDEGIKVESTGASHGRCCGFLNLSNIPKFAQMKAGRNTEDGVIDGVKLFPFLPGPTHILKVVEIPSSVVNTAKPLPTPTVQPTVQPTTTTTTVPITAPTTVGRDSLYPDLNVVSSATPTPKCPKGHTMLTMTNSMMTAEQGGYSRGFQCNLCSINKPILDYTEPYHCSACTYDVCLHCAPKLMAQTASPEPSGASYMDKFRFAAMKVASAQKTGAPLVNLKPGWSERRDPISGKTFYVNTTTGDTTWDPPVEGTLEDNMANDEHLSRSQVDRSIPDLELPSGWEETYDANVGKSFYLNTVTREVTWTRPTMNQQFNKPLSPVVGPRKGSIPPTPLPVGWIEQKDLQGRTYYFNSSTGVTTWERPVESLSTLPSLPSPWIEQKDPKTGKVFYANTVTHQTSWERPTSPSTKPAIPVASQPSPLPSPWIEQKDPNTGKIFYANTITHQTSWERPTGNPTQHIPTPTTSSALPAPWMEQRDPKTGKVFYANTVTHQTSWERPGISITNPSNIPTNIPSNIPSNIPTSTGGLPVGWVQSFDPSTNRPYYTHTPTGRVQWDLPTASNPSMGPAMPTTSNNPLPFGWTETFDPSARRPYYVNTTTGQTSWERPSNQQQRFY
jgi:hypothetical protein